MTPKLPPGAARIAKRYPRIWAAYEQLGEACAQAGPLDAKTVRLVKQAGGKSKLTVNREKAQQLDINKKVGAHQVKCIPTPQRWAFAP